MKVGILYVRIPWRETSLESPHYGWVYSIKNVCPQLSIFFLAKGANTFPLSFFFFQHFRWVEKVLLQAKDVFDCWVGRNNNNDKTIMKKLELETIWEFFWTSGEKLINLNLQYSLCMLCYLILSQKFFYKSKFQISQKLAFHLRCLKC